jgi:glutaredoxin
MLDSLWKAFGNGLMVTLTLYSTEGCHLCEEAEQLLHGAATRWPGLGWEVVDIASDDSLFERYGWLIPVLACDGAGELRWPFDAEALEAFLLQASADPTAAAPSKITTPGS